MEHGAGFVVGWPGSPGRGNQPPLGQRHRLVREEAGELGIVAIGQGIGDVVGAEGAEVQARGVKFGRSDHRCREDIVAKTRAAAGRAITGQCLMSSLAAALSRS